MRRSGKSKKMGRSQSDNHLSKGSTSSKSSWKHSRSQPGSISEAAQPRDEISDGGEAEYCLITETSGMMRSASIASSSSGSAPNTWNVDKLRSQSLRDSGYNSQRSSTLSGQSETYITPTTFITDGVFEKSDDEEDYLHPVPYDMNSKIRGREMPPVPGQGGGGPSRPPGRREVPVPPPPGQGGNEPPPLVRRTGMGGRPPPPTPGLQTPTPNRSMSPRASPQPPRRQVPLPPGPQEDYECVDTSQNTDEDFEEEYLEPAEAHRMSVAPPTLPQRNGETFEEMYMDPQDHNDEEIEDETYSAPDEFEPPATPKRGFQPPPVQQHHQDSDPEIEEYLEPNQEQLRQPPPSVPAPPAARAVPAPPPARQLPPAPSNGPTEIYCEADGNESGSGQFSGPPTRMQPPPSRTLPQVPSLPSRIPNHGVPAAVPPPPDMDCGAHEDTQEVYEYPEETISPTGPPTRRPNLAPPLPEPNNNNVIKPKTPRTSSSSSSSSRTAESSTPSVGGRLLDTVAIRNVKGKLRTINDNTFTDPKQEEKPAISDQEFESLPLKERIKMIQKGLSTSSIAPKPSNKPAKIPNQIAKTPSQPSVGQGRQGALPAVPPTNVEPRYSDTRSEASDEGSGSGTFRRPDDALPAPPPSGKTAASVRPQCQPDVDGYRWYHGSINRAQTEERLTMDGMYLVRDSSKKDEAAPYVMCVYFKRIWYLKIRKRSDISKYALGTYHENELTFSSVAQLVQYHRNNPITLAGTSGGQTTLKHEADTGEEIYDETS